MGSWGTGLYSNDVAEDLKDMCKEIFPCFSMEEGNKLVFEAYKEMLDMKLMDDEYASFWYILSDWQWKHGMLNDEIKKTTLELLENYTGIADWEADASAADVKKRKAVLDKLKAQLLSPQPPYKKLKADIRKPKYKAGDVIIIKTNNTEYWQQRMHGLTLYKDRSGKIKEASEAGPFEIEFRNKYLALLCVGTAFNKYSRYINEIYHEDCVYAVYDYLSDKKPDIDILNKCGFYHH